MAILEGALSSPHSASQAAMGGLLAPAMLPLLPRPAAHIPKMKSWAVPAPGQPQLCRRAQ